LELSQSIFKLDVSQLQFIAFALDDLEALVAGTIAGRNGLRNCPRRPNQRCPD
jgi:hypothetical protein